MINNIFPSRAKNFIMPSFLRCIPRSRSLTNLKAILHLKMSLNDAECRRLLLSDKASSEWLQGMNDFSSFLFFYHHSFVMPITHLTNGISSDRKIEEFQPVGNDRRSQTKRRKTSSFNLALRISFFDQCASNFRSIRAELFCQST